MTDNLLDTLSKEFSGDVVESIASTLGEESNKIRIAIKAAQSCLISRLADKVSTTGEAADMLNWLQRNKFDGRRITYLERMVADPDGVSALIENGGPMIYVVLGSRAKQVIEWLSSLCGISTISAHSTLCLTIPLILGRIGQIVNDSGWNSSNLRNLLTDQKDYLRISAPELASFQIPGIPENISESRRATLGFSRHPARSGGSWWNWFLLLLGLMVLGYLFTR